MKFKLAFALLFALIQTIHIDEDSLYHHGDYDDQESTHSSNQQHRECSSATSTHSDQNSNHTKPHEPLHISPIPITIPICHPIPPIPSPEPMPLPIINPVCLPDYQISSTVPDQFPINLALFKGLNSFYSDLKANGAILDLIYAANHTNPDNSTNWRLIYQLKSLCGSISYLSCQLQSKGSNWLVLNELITVHLTDVFLLWSLPACTVTLKINTYNLLEGLLVHDPFKCQTQQKTNHTKHHKSDSQENESESCHSKDHANEHSSDKTHGYNFNPQKNQNWRKKAHYYGHVNNYNHPANQLSNVQFQPPVFNIGASTGPGDY